MEEKAAVEAVTLLDSMGSKDLIAALATVIDDVVVCGLIDAPCCACMLCIYANPNIVAS